MTLIGAVLSLIRICGLLFHNTDSFKGRLKTSSLVLPLPGQKGTWQYRGHVHQTCTITLQLICVSISVAMEERAIQRAERRRKLEEAKQQREEEKLVWTVGKMKDFHTILMTRNAVLTSKTQGPRKIPLVSKWSFTGCQKANIQHTLKKKVPATLIFREPTSLSISCITLCSCSCKSRSSLPQHPPALFHTYFMTLTVLAKDGKSAEIHLIGPGK